ncbi:GPR1/FUN34/yaaH family-domain-containing protein [Halenospora varia]|nr:GPR1/FUN34/yaaH family-domain-containing protein [Halenospora varia]
MDFSYDMERRAQRNVDPGALGIAVFSVTNTMLAFLLLETKGIHEDVIIVGMLWFGGKAFEYTVFACFGAYYFSYATTMTPAFSVNSGYTTTNEFQNAIALLFLAWFFLFILFTIAGIKTNLVLFTIFVSVTLTAAFVSASHFVTAMGADNTALNLQKTAGAFLMLGALAGWYDLTHILFKDQKMRWAFPLGELNGHRDSQIEIESQISREAPKIDIDLPSRA